ncbi:winged helix-turn-helix domain-containing protein [Paraglaciecola aquimarina]|uniref:Winged helix-turn-helix domain-containing protein n=1 Tax=Paraglaciecola algarum TaxID=3050085 RepID=A0ABS9DAC7_9ALTE|nr:winged helix-turn-helix domain-containing protein [Paraglaciecola sp. G1-23]MCF2948967.1 winged helix-turn-helix domain-containing protein [Paraglaciecola sp. G1-23]
MQKDTHSRFNDEKLQAFMLGPVLVCPAKNQIKINQLTIKVQPKAMSVLNYLACHHDRVISSEELIDVLWVGRIVTQNSVQKSINTLRKLLAKYFPQQTVIENYSKKGYQLKISPVFQEISTQEGGTFNVKANSVKPSRTKVKQISIVTFCGLLLFAVVAYFWTSINQQQLFKNHKTTFNGTKIFSHQLILANLISPHPNNNDLAYVKGQEVNNQTQTDNQSLQTLLIKNQSLVDDWRLATSKGQWLHLAWSPNGKHLVAIEQQEKDLQPNPRQFYVQEPALYTIHIFTLNLSTRKLEEKQLLSQWHGRINSVTWLDNREFEFLATQGESTTFQRFSYTPNNQILNIVEPSPHSPLPLYSASHNNILALVSTHKKGSKIDFIDSQQQLILSKLVNFEVQDLSWIPDGSGVLLSNKQNPNLVTVYLDGDDQSIRLDKTATDEIRFARYSPDGTTIYFSKVKQSPKLTFISITGTNINQEAVTISGFNGLIMNKNKGLVYVKSVTNKQQVWAKTSSSPENRTHEKLLTEMTSSAITDLIEVQDQGLVFKSASNIYYFDLKTNNNQLLLADANKLSPIYFDLLSNQLIAIGEVAQAKNIWRIDLNQNVRKQLTFGAIGSTITDAQNIYFQYIGQKGLWKLNARSLNLAKINISLAINSKLLAVDEKAVYFVTGSQCNESDIFYQEFNNQNAITYLNRQTNYVSTLSFSPNQGVLTKDCITPPSSISVLH